MGGQHSEPTLEPLLNVVRIKNVGDLLQDLQFVRGHEDATPPSELGLNRRCKAVGCSIARPIASLAILSRNR